MAESLLQTEGLCSFETVSFQKTPENEKRELAN
jgi:hypothetical protein